MQKKSGVVGVVPIGNVNRVVLKIVAANLQGIFRLPVDILDNRKLPEKSFDEKRNQYNAVTILSHMEKHWRQPHNRLLGILSVDLFVPVLTHVFGEARLGGKVATISVLRLQKGKSGGNVRVELFYERLAKVAVHELAHTFGLVHCRNKKNDCVMKASYGLSDLDTYPLYFCDYCQAILEDVYRRKKLCTV